jgi:hypothetical protein
MAPHCRAEVGDSIDREAAQQENSENLAAPREPQQPWLSVDQVPRGSARV